MEKRGIEEGRRVNWGVQPWGGIMEADRNSPVPLEEGEGP